VGFGSGKLGWKESRLCLGEEEEEEEEKSQGARDSSLGL
jgi:hypothetical protein